MQAPPPLNACKQRLKAVCRRRYTTSKLVWVKICFAIHYVEDVIDSLQKICSVHRGERQLASLNRSSYGCTCCQAEDLSCPLSVIFSKLIDFKCLSVHLVALDLADWLPMLNNICKCAQSATPTLSTFNVALRSGAAGGLQH